MLQDTAGEAEYKSTSRAHLFKPERKDVLDVIKLSDHFSRLAVTNLSRQSGACHYLPDCAQRIPAISSDLIPAHDPH